MVISTIDNRLRLIPQALFSGLSSSTQQQAAAAAAAEAAHSHSKTNFHNRVRSHSNLGGVVQQVEPEFAQLTQRLVSDLLALETEISH